LKNPVLVNYSTTVIANFANYTSAVKFGSTVTFTVNSPGTFSNVSSNVTTRSIPTKAGGVAWVTVWGRKIGTVTVTGSSGNFAGSTNISYINQPATIKVQAGLNKPITGLGNLSFDVLSDDPAPTFTNFSSIKGASFAAQPNPLPPAAGVNTTSVSLVAPSGVNVNPGTLFWLSYLVVDKGVPIITVDNLSASLADINGTPVTPDFFFNVTYYDVNGIKLFP